MVSCSKGRLCHHVARGNPEKYSSMFQHIKRFDCELFIVIRTGTEKERKSESLKIIIFTLKKKKESYS